MLKYIRNPFVIIITYDPNNSNIDQLTKLFMYGFKWQNIKTINISRLKTKKILFDIIHGFKLHLLKLQYIDSLLVIINGKSNTLKTYSYSHN